MAWFDPATSYAGGGLDRETGQNIPGALWQRLMDVLTHLGGADGRTRTGILKMPDQPAFFAHNAATVTNQTGNGATVTVPFGTEISDRGSCFASNTLTVPANAGGLWDFAGQVTISDLTAAMNQYLVRLVTSNRTYVLASGDEVHVAGGIARINWKVTNADMDAGDTATVTLQVSGGAGDTADIFGIATNPQTFFAGRLAA